MLLTRDNPLENAGSRVFLLAGPQLSNSWGSIPVGLLPDSGDLIMEG
jgi:hypothetical protein